MRGFVLKQWNTESGALCISIAFNLPISMIQLVLQTPALSHSCNSRSKQQRSAS
jgi:hypothetical protein